FEGVASRLTDLEAREGRYTVAGGVDRERPAEGPRVRGGVDRRSDRDAALAHQIPRRVEQLKHRLLRKGDSNERRGGGVGGNAQLAGRTGRDGDSARYD